MNPVYGVVGIAAAAVWASFVGYEVGFGKAREQATKLIHHQLMFIDLVYQELNAAYPKGDAPLREKVKGLLPEFEVLLEYPSVAHQLQKAKEAAKK